nr:zinc finger, CCHC-type [Tanacetum cinerariifolium]
MFEEQAKKELFKIVKAFYTCKQEDGQSVSSYLLKMKSYLDTFERLGYAMPNELNVSLIFNSLNKDYDQFVQNYNMHNMGKTLAELHAMLKLYEKGIPKKAETLSMLAILEGEIQKDKKKSQGTKELYAFPNNTWVYDTGYGTHIFNTSQGVRECKKLKHGALSLYMGNGMRADVEAIGSFDLILPSGLIIVLDNCHFAPTVTRGVVSISRLVKNCYIHTFTNYGSSVSKDNVFYFNVIPRDGIYRIDMHNIYSNVSSNYDVSNKRAKLSNKTPKDLWDALARHMLGSEYDKSMWFDQEKRVQKIDHLARSLLIQGLSNDIYSLIDSNKTAKDLWDALARHMLSLEYESESESEYETSKYYDNSTNYGLFVNNDDDQEIFHDAIESASENFIENHIDSQKDYDKSDVDHNDSEEKDHLVDKLIRKFNHKIAKRQNRVEKSNQQSKDFVNQNKDLQDKYDVLKNQATTFEMNNKEFKRVD